MATPGRRRARRSRGSVEEFASGALRVSVYAGIDPLTSTPSCAAAVTTATAGAGESWVGDFELEVLDRDA
ncbi:MAG: hypothetical protein ACRDT0_12970 [Pseudonocardiaceae bacterium]